MNIIGLRITLVTLASLLIIGSVLLLCLKRLDTYKKLVLLSSLCFAITGINLVFTYGFYQEVPITFSLAFLGLVAGFAFHIGAAIINKEEQLVVTKKNKIISLLLVLASVAILLAAFFIIKGISKTEVMLSRFIPFIFIIIFGAAALYFFIRSIIAPTNGSKYLKDCKLISIIMVIEIVVGMAYSLAAAMDNLLLVAIIFMVFILLQGVIVYLVYGGKKHE